MVIIVLFRLFLPLGNAVWYQVDFFFFFAQAVMIDSQINHPFGSFLLGLIWFD